ncbi:hypothetical protein BN7_2245 [Wickerhamomyces ciferrii]|uniref:glucan endo-1,3-beta-D-glucosidase n=1 Tax=Wickerhamomyces ciferrii (strain ATCC 14091 / BCRC 22168 / CBS 111 / JCM 3599 / NBRC 0793 / NRRL Y-1031 F-60-10) TaxID=1206466 RepID=K0KI65_WICCF|nr:uncharacterized protein BN7_2245 [Wickerhamomyces ciferrii]CCH42701.1 hypothetical protein BN7_2245 [Wickerhamomyces ciferrii]
MFSIRSKSRNVKDGRAGLKSSVSRASSIPKKIDDDNSDFVTENTSMDQTTIRPPSLSKEHEDQTVMSSNTFDFENEDEASMLNIISIESSFQSSPEDENQGKLLDNEDMNKEEQQHPIREEPGSYSTFQDNGERIENPTSYILETDSDDYDEETDGSLPIHKGPESSKIISFGSGFQNDLKSGREVYQEGIDIKSSGIPRYEYHGDNRSGSSVYSSQDTVRITGGIESQHTPIINTPQNYIDSSKYDLKSAPLPLTTRRLGSSRAPESFFTTSANIQETYYNRPIENLSIAQPKSAAIPPLRPSAQENTNPSTLDLDQNLEQLRSTTNLQNNSAILKKPTTGNGVQDNASQWDSAMPALLYSNNIQTGNKNNLDTVANSGKQTLPETLLRGDGSILGSELGTNPDYLDVIKRSLSRSRSKRKTGPNNDPNKGDSPPLLFSQDRNSLSRSRSVLKDGQKDPETQDTTDIEQNKNEEFNDEESIIDTLRDADDPYNALTKESELNCKKKDSRFFQSAKDLPPMFDGERNMQYEKEKDGDDDLYNYAEKGDLNNEKLEKLKLDKDGNGDRDFGSLNWEERLRKPIGNKIYMVVIWILIMVILLMACIFIPLLLVYSRGTESTTFNYLSNINPLRRSEMLLKFYPFGNLNNTQNAIGNNNGTTHSLPASNSSSQNDKLSDGSVSIAGISKFENIPKKYQQNEEIQQMMNNTALKNVFYGIDYAPRNVIYPICGATLHEVMLDVAQLSQVTSRLRTYGTQCNQAKFILDSIKTLNLNVSLAMGVWIGPNDDINQLQVEDMKSLLRQYPRKYFDAVFIGNEVLFREEQSPEKLIEYIHNAKSFIKNELKWDLPVGTSELGPRSDFNVIAASDIYGSNSHPFFTGKTVQLATKWVFDFVKYQIEPMKDNIKSKAQVIISEIGWPYHGGKYKKAVAGKRHMQYFLNSWICEAKAKAYPWYFFEAYDEPWKQIYHSQNSKWETEWGLFTADRKLKEGITFPTC